MATPKPQRSPEETEDKIFLVTLKENPSSSSSDPRVVYLEMAAAEMLSEGKSLLLSRDLMERVLIDRLSGEFPNSEPTFDYLIGSYRRAHEEIKKISNMKDKTLRLEMESTAKQAKKLAVSYARIHLGNPDLLSSNMKSVNSLLPLVFAAVSSGVMLDGFGGNDLGSGVDCPPPGFLEELFKDSNFDTLDPILKGLYEDLRGNVLKVSALGNFQQPLRALLYLVNFPVGGKSLVNHPWWIPKGVCLNGRVIEMTSILGPFFQVSALPDHTIFKSQPDVGKTREIVAAWKKLNYSNLGGYSDKMTPQYQIWRNQRTKDIVLPQMEPDEVPLSLPTESVVLSETDIMRQEFQAEEKKWEQETQNLKRKVEDLKLDVEVQSAKVTKLTQEKAAAMEDVTSLSQENAKLRSKGKTPADRKIFRDHEAELEKAHNEVEYWKQKASEYLAKNSQDKRKWDDMQASMNARMNQYHHDNEQLKTTVSLERARVAQLRAEKDSLQEYAQSLEHDLHQQGQRIAEMKSEFNERETNLIKTIHKGQRKFRDATTEFEGNRMYIDHLTDEIVKAVDKAKEW